MKNSIGGAAATLIVLCSGCTSGLRDIDAEVDELVQQSSDRIGGGAVAPARQWQRPAGENDSRLNDKSPETTNPAAEELQFRQKAGGEPVDRLLEDLRTRQSEGYGPAVELDLPGVWRRAMRSSPEYLSAEEDYILDAISLLVERHQWSPRLFGSIGAAFDQVQDDGDVASTVSIVNELAVRKRLPFGGEAAARWVWNATENLRSSATGQYVQASRLALDVSIPLLRGAGWVAQESLIQAERSLIYSARDFEAFRRRFLADLARDYFDLLRQRKAIENTREQVRQNQDIVRENERKYEAGRVALFDVDLAKNQELSARSDLVNQEESYLLSLDRFKVRLGFSGLETLVLQEVRLAVPEPNITLADATDAALRYRLDLQNRRDQLEDSLRSVRNARNDLLPDLDIAGNVGLPTDTDEDEGGVVYELDDSEYGASATLELPLDRRIERLSLRRAEIAYQRDTRDFDRFEDELVLDVRARVREIERAKVNLLLAEQQVQITERRAREQEIKRDEVTTRERTDTQDELRAARDDRDQAETDLRNAVLDFLDATGQLRVARDGTFQPLPGMDLTQPAEQPPPPLPLPEAGGEPIPPGPPPPPPLPQEGEPAAVDQPPQAPPAPPTGEPSNP